MKKTFLFFALAALFATLPTAKAAPYTEKLAFCSQKLEGQLQWIGQYEYTKRFNDCMRNADRLIQNYEEEKRQREIRWKKESAEWQKQEKQRKLKEAAREEARQKQMQQTVDNMDDLFR